MGLGGVGERSIGQSSRWEQKGCGEALISSQRDLSAPPTLSLPISTANSLASLGCYAPENKHICDATVLPHLTVIRTFGLVLECELETYPITESGKTRQILVVPHQPGMGLPCNFKRGGVQQPFQEGACFGFL